MLPTLGSLQSISNGYVEVAYTTDKHHERSIVVLIRFLLSINKSGLQCDRASSPNRQETIHNRPPTLEVQVQYMFYATLLLAIELLQIPQCPDMRS